MIETDILEWTKLCWIQIQNHGDKQEEIKKVQDAKYFFDR